MITICHICSIYTTCNRDHSSIALIVAFERDVQGKCRYGLLLILTAAKLLWLCWEILGALVFDKLANSFIMCV